VTLSPKRYGFAVGEMSVCSPALVPLFAETPITARVSGFVAKVMSLAPLAEPLAPNRQEEVTRITIEVVPTP